MAQEPFANQSWPPKDRPIGSNMPPLNTGEGESPLATPPNPKIDLRTMNSDLNSLKASGGAKPEPYTPTMVPKPETKPVVTQSSFEPAKIGNASPMPLPTKIPGTKSKKGLFWGILILVVVIGLGAIGYFFVYPSFTPKTMPANQSPTTLPQASTATPSVSSSAPSQNQGTAPAASTSTTIQNHVSLFTTPADTTTDVVLAALTPEGLKTILPFSPVSTPIMKETVFRDNQNNVLTSAQVISLFLANDLTSDVLNAFNPDPTVFVYADRTGSWPGLILALNSSSSVTEATINQELEASTHLNNFFLTDPGTAGSTWRSGTTNGLTNRYLTFSNSGFALNYVWVGNKLLISTSYTGFKTALSHLQ